MVDLPGEPGKTCWCWLISTFTVELYGKDTGLKLEPLVLVGREKHRMDVECNKGCKRGIQSSLDTKFANNTLEIKYIRKKCCGECNLPKVECGGQSQFMCEEEASIGKPADPAVIDLWDLRNNLNSSKDKIKDILDYLLNSPLWATGAFSCDGTLRCGSLKRVRGLCGKEPKWV